MAKGDFVQYLFSSVGAGLTFWFLSGTGDSFGAKAMGWIVDLLGKIPGLDDTTTWYFSAVKYIVIGLISVGLGFALAEYGKKLT